MHGRLSVESFFALSVCTWVLVAFSLPFWGVILCVALMLGGLFAYIFLADERFATEQQINRGLRFCYGLIILNVFCFIAATIAYWKDIRPYALIALPAAASIVCFLADIRFARRTYFCPPSALLCTASEKRFLYRAAVWQRLMYFPDAAVIVVAVFSINDFWRGHIAQGISFFILAIVFSMISLGLRRCRNAALAAATEQARYRHGTVGEILHPACMSPINRIVPAHIRR